MADNRARRRPRQRKRPPPARGSGLNVLAALYPIELQLLGFSAPSPSLLAGFDPATSA